MKELFWKIYGIWRANFTFRTLLSSTMSFMIGLFFIIFNGALGIIYESLWHGTICIYYILLTLIRGIIVFYQRKKNYRDIVNGRLLRNKVSKYTHIMLFALNLALIVPITIMVKGERAYNYGLVPAIAMAAYTFYKIGLSTINLKNARKETNCLIKELRVISMIDTLVAILSLQNAMIIANGGGDDMHVVMSYSSAGIFAFIVILTIRSMLINKE